MASRHRILTPSHAASHASGWPAALRLLRRNVTLMATLLVVPDDSLNPPMKIPVCGWCEVRVHPVVRVRARARGSCCTCALVHAAVRVSLRLLVLVCVIAPRLGRVKELV